MKNLKLTEFELVDPNVDYSGTQTIFIDFDGAANLSYDNTALNISINIPFITDSNLSEDAQFQILTDLNDSFAGTGVSFTASTPVNEEYSTIYVGGDGSLFSEYGNFAGLSETIDAGNQIKNDEAFVFSDKISSTDAVTETIAHEAAHLIGYKHAGDVSVDELSDFAAVAAIANDTSKFTALDGLEDDGLGYSVGISGKNVVIGSYCDDDNGEDSGSIYSYRWNGTSYDEIKIMASDGDIDDWFGVSVDIYGDSIVAGSDWGDGIVADSGAAYVYTWNGTSYNELKLSASDGAEYDSFGYASAIDDNIVVVGAYAADSIATDSGSAYVYRWNGVSYDETKLSASDGAADDFFGYAVAVSGDNVAIGAYGDDDNGDNSGSAYVYRWNGTSYDENKLTVSNASHELFGYSIAMDNDIVAVGAYCDPANGSGSGSVYVYRWNGTSYDGVNLTASDAANAQYFGKSVAVSGNYIVVGAYGDNVNGVASGSVYVYRWNGDSYDEFKVTAPDGNALDFYGRSVSVDGNKVLVGAYGDDDKGSASGSVYSFDLLNVIDNPSSDFDANGKSDILFYNQSTGDVGAWLEDSGDWLSLGYASPADWEIVGHGDFSGDNASDILWQNKIDGTVGVWENGTDWEEKVAVSQSDWEVVGVGDFNGNNTSDVLWQNKIDGTVGVWESGESSNWEEKTVVSRSDWGVVGVDDFNGNGTADVLWQNKVDGTVGIWESGESSNWEEKAAVSLSDWEIAGTGDFDGDGTDDVLWQNKIDGTVGVWESGISTNWEEKAAVSLSDWEIAGTGDFNGNGTDDILWHSKVDGTVGMWESGTDWQNLGNIGDDWSISIA